MIANSITVDGLTGSGKTAVGLLLAEALGYFYLEPYTLGQAIIPTLLQANIVLSDRRQVLSQLKTVSMVLSRRPVQQTAFVQRRQIGRSHFYKVTRAQPWHLRVNGEKLPNTFPTTVPGFTVTWKFIEWLMHEPDLHAALMETAHQLTETQDVVIAGDRFSPAGLLGAGHKFVLTADVWIRTIRLTEQARERGAILDRSEQQQFTRDSDDRYARRPPHLQFPNAAVRIDTSNMTVEQVARQISPTVRLNTAISSTYQRQF